MKQMFADPEVDIIIIDADDIITNSCPNQCGGGSGVETTEQPI